MDNSVQVVLIVVLWGMGNVVVLGALFFCFTIMLAISMMGCNQNLFISQLDTTRNQPSQSARSVAARSFHGWQGNPTPNDDQRGEGGTLADTGTRHVAQDPKQAAQVYASVLGVLKTTPADVFPSNRITTRCGSCRKVIPTGEGYRHYSVGTRKTFCRGCHVSQGLPARADLRRDGSAGAGEAT